MVLYFTHYWKENDIVLFQFFKLFIFLDNSFVHSFNFLFLIMIFFHELFDSLACICLF